MLPPEAETPPPQEPAATAPDSDRPAYLPFGAFAPPSVIAPARAAWARTYELPSARQVVNVGLQLTQRANRAIGRASLYIGLLSLGAFGPAAILVLVGIARLLSDPGTAATITSDNPFLVIVDQPELSGPLALIYVVGIVGAILLIAISIDAEAMAIAILGGIAADQPLTLQQALRRARQTFWRLFASGLLVTLASSVLSLIIAWPFLRPLDTNQGVSFIASMLATLAVTPFAFAATGIVLGDAGALETLRRSVGLFRARPRIALVVTLFTLVTAAIQTFAFGGGADLLGRIAEFFHLGEGAGALIVPGILVLAFIIAFGSLTFTIAAIVAAPQVAAFLGLTFYSAGLDKARAPVGPGSRVRWVSIPMTTAIAVLGVVVLAGIPTIASFQPREGSAVLAFLRDAAAPHGVLVLPSGVPVVIDDPAGDEQPSESATADIVTADISGLGSIPEWMLDELFSCDAEDVACGDAPDATIPLEEGALLFAQRMAAVPSRDPAQPHAEWGQMVRVEGSIAAPARAGEQFEGANVRFVTELDRGKLRLRELFYDSGSWSEVFTTSRSVWRGDLLITLVPVEDFPAEPTAWDVYSSVQAGQSTSSDNIRDADGEVLELGTGKLPWIDIFDPRAST